MIITKGLENPFERDTLERLYRLTTELLSKIDRSSGAYGAMMDAIALARIDLFGQTLLNFISENGERIPLFSRGLLVPLGHQLSRGDIWKLEPTRMQLQAYQPF